MAGALHIPQGRGRHRVTKLSGPDNSIHRKSSMVQIVNDDQLCLARAIGVGLAKHNIISDEVWEFVTQANKFLISIEILTRYHRISALGFKDIKNKNRPVQKYLALL